MPAIPIPEYALRGLMARVARTQGKNLDAVSAKEVNAILDTNRYLAVQSLNPHGPSKAMTTIVDKLYAGPFPKDQFRPYSFEYWYNYFYSELNDNNHRSTYATAVIRHDGSLYGEADMPRKKESLKEMLAIGFEKFTLKDHLDAAALTIRFQHDKQQLMGNKVIVFRGDGRPWKKVCTDHGCKAQSRVSRLRVERGMENDWHPFKNAGKDVWYRRGHGDNCLFSAVSVTPYFEVATSFPLLSEVKASNPTAVGHAIVVVRSGGTDALKSLEATRTNVYLIRATGAFDTQTKQKLKAGSFPEYASDELQWTDHLVWFSVIRIHFAHHEGHQSVIDGFQFLQPDEVIEHLIGRHAAAQLKQWTLETVRKGSAGGEGAGIPCYPMVDNVPQAPRDFMVVKVLNAFIPGRPKAPGLVM